MGRRAAAATVATTVVATAATAAATAARPGRLILATTAAAHPMATARTTGSVGSPGLTKAPWGLAVASTARRAPS